MYFSLNRLYIVVIFFQHKLQKGTSSVKLWKNGAFKPFFIINDSIYIHFFSKFVTKINKCIAILATCI